MDQELTGKSQVRATAVGGYRTSSNQPDAIHKEFSLTLRQNQSQLVDQGRLAHQLELE